MAGNGYLWKDCYVVDKGKGDQWFMVFSSKTKQKVKSYPKDRFYYKKQGSDVWVGTRSSGRKY